MKTWLKNEKKPWKYDRKMALISQKLPENLKKTQNDETMRHKITIFGACAP